MKQSLVADSPSRRSNDAVTRVLVVDDHQVVRAGLIALLSAAEDMEVVGEASDLSSAVRRIAGLRPDVVIMDVHLPDGSGVDALPLIRKLSPATRVLMLSAFADEGLLDRSRKAGASGYAVKRISGLNLVSAVRRVASGADVFHHAPLRRPVEQRLNHLSGRERSVLELVAQGLTNKEIADRLYVAEKTVKNYVSQILAKLGVSHRAAAAAQLAALEVAEHPPFPPAAW